jgi:hypothetical protein
LPELSRLGSGEVGVVLVLAASFGERRESSGDGVELRPLPMSTSEKISEIPSVLRFEMLVRREVLEDESWLRGLSGTVENRVSSGGGVVTGGVGGRGLG